MTNQKDGKLGQKLSATSFAEKKPYARPLLIDYGDVRDITLAPTPGLNTESGYTYTTVYEGLSGEAPPP